VDPVSKTGRPVSAFTTAVQSRDLSAASALLAYDVRLSIPPLHYTRQGAPEVAEGLAALFGSFGEFQYGLRSRYLGPATVTDEVVFTARQTGPFLGAPPNRQVSSVPARVMIDHDEASITKITLWPDLAALRASVAGADQVIDLTAATRAGGMITTLRATIPPRQTRVVIATQPGHSQADVPEPLTSPPAGPTVNLSPIPKLPTPRSVRQRRAILAGGTMLLAASALATWVAVGALNLPETRSITSGQMDKDAFTARAAGPGLAKGSSTTDTDAAATDTTADASSAADAQARLDPAQQLAAGHNMVIIDSDLLFATNSATLAPRARQLLTDLLEQALRQKRQGTVVVAGHTDDLGTDRYNLALSKKRAKAVAAVLAKGLRPSQMTVKYHGYGESHPRKPNTSKTNRTANRRVTVQFPG
jgi:outer membrane protein OmpA-like peptidoglycan-associated protein